MRGPQTGRHLSDGGGDVCLRAGVQVFALLQEVENFLDSIRKKRKAHASPILLRCGTRKSVSALRESAS